MGLQTKDWVHGQVGFPTARNGKPFRTGPLLVSSTDVKRSRRTIPETPDTPVGVC